MGIKTWRDTSSAKPPLKQAWSATPPHPTHLRISADLLVDSVERRGLKVQQVGRNLGYILFLQIPANALHPLQASGLPRPIISQGMAQEVRGRAGLPPSVPPAQGYLVGTSTLLAEVEGDAVSQLLGAQQVDVVRDKEAPGTRHRGTPPGDKGWGPKIRRPLWLCKLGRRMRGLALSDSMSHLSGDDISLPSRHLPHPPPCSAAPKAFHQLLSVQRDCRITECSGLEGTSVRHLVQPPC